ncbi:alpha-ketoglutarate-dependent dioxygenase AlkB [Alteromonas sp. C1M14]|uniref:alpha-ketoglutarate-dependent dioxygenase AlkB family protein n=1 Tax=Alteromonas sp. C1M14 TaxID=2841567 RepID=UPI001C08A5AE|nr:alpha-ketoglutarate-dependent dioxygenase AlkB [Alteromonas sp. C1M14]MBU2977574.1 alpha-ketoglutarate-dependent dioxygenase AlkB [Alteromonas sp. C1M14]
MQFSLFDDDNEHAPVPRRLDLPGADVVYIGNWLDGNTASDYFRHFASSLCWQQDTIKLFGKPVKIPRLQAWYGDATTEYTYSGLTMTPHAWTRALTTLRMKCQQTANASFNSVLANWYRHGQDSMGMHADDEPELGAQPIIASLTLGQARPFIFKHKKTKLTHRLLLEHGSLLLMQGDTQREYLHGINKTTKAVGGRINLTFRYVYPAIPEFLCKT